MNPSISINVNVCNPGQVFACCGLLELANRLAGANTPAKGWFENIDETYTSFLIEAIDVNGDEIKLCDVIQKLKQCNVTGDNANLAGPLKLGSPFDFLIDWRKIYPQSRNVKTWAGGQNITGIVPALKVYLPDKPNHDLLFFHSEMLNEKGGKVKPTGFDISRSEGSLDAGFSMDDLSNKYSIRPAISVELLALIGLQRFCPANGEERRDRIYNIWDTPLPIGVASLAVCYPLFGVDQTSYEFKMFMRDPEGRFKSFNTARKKK